MPLEKIYLVTFFFFGLFVHLAAATPLFVGSPAVKVSEAGNSRVAEPITAEKAAGLQCVIARDGDRLVWVTRGNIELAEISAGVFTTYIALNGSGYIRVIDPDLKEAAALFGETEEKFDYVEHLLLGLRSVTYYGTRK